MFPNGLNWCSKLFNQVRLGLKAAAPTPAIAAKTKTNWGTLPSRTQPHRPCELFEGQDDLSLCPIQVEALTINFTCIARPDPCCNEIEIPHAKAFSETVTGCAVDSVVILLILDSRRFLLLRNDIQHHRLMFSRFSDRGR